MLSLQALMTSAQVAIWSKAWHILMCRMVAAQTLVLETEQPWGRVGMK
jgi:hypothetical protein